MGIETAIAIAGAVAAAATAATGIASAVQKPPKPPAIPKPKTDEALTSEIRASEAERKRKTDVRRGMGSTILTSPLGIEDEASVTTSSLLGG